MSFEQKLERMVQDGTKRDKGINPRRVPPFKRTELSPDAPAPATKAMIADRGLELSTNALEAWSARLNGIAMVDVAQQMGVSIATAKALINEAHGAIAQDLKENLNLNRELDLSRIDGLLSSYYPSAKAGDIDAANLVLKCLGHRAKLTGAEPPPVTGKTDAPTNVLVWIQQQMPSINKIVDALPIE